MQHYKKIPKNISIMLICSENDDIVPKAEVEDFYKVFKGERELFEIE
jgi:poly(3-hydroxyalkanoate) synthetase